MYIENIYEAKKNRQSQAQVVERDQYLTRRMADYSGNREILALCCLSRRGCFFRWSDQVVYGEVSLIIDDDLDVSHCRECEVS